MTSEELDSWVKREPFVPFRIHVQERIQYDVAKPRFAMVGRNCVMIGLRKNIDSPFFDEPVLVLLKDVTRVESLSN